jgi:hypothetical protein
VSNRRRAIECQVSVVGIPTLSYLMTTGWLSVRTPFRRGRLATRLLSSITCIPSAFERFTAEISSPSGPAICFRPFRVPGWFAGWVDFTGLGIRQSDAALRIIVSFRTSTTFGSDEPWNEDRLSLPSHRPIHEPAPRRVKEQKSCVSSTLRWCIRFLEV